MSEQKERTHRVLFVCLGNICRSPAAEAIFLKHLNTRGLVRSFVIDSAGTSAFHAGNPADRRMIASCLERGYDVKSISRGFDPHHDFDQFDWIIGMDTSNVRNLNQFARDSEDATKVHLFTDFLPNKKPSGIPDPYMGGADGFFEVIDLIERGMPNLFETILT